MVSEVRVKHCRLEGKFQEVIGLEIVIGPEVGCLSDFWFQFEPSVVLQSLQKVPHIDFISTYRGSEGSLCLLDDLPPQPF